MPWRQLLSCHSDAGDDLHARAIRLAVRTAADAAAIWEWGTIHRVVSGLHSGQIGFQPFGRATSTERKMSGNGRQRISLVGSFTAAARDRILLGAPPAANARNSDR